jgi:hypothetical protein
MSGSLNESSGKLRKSTWENANWLEMIHGMMAVIIFRKEKLVDSFIGKKSEITVTKIRNSSPDHAN